MEVLEKFLSDLFQTTNGDKSSSDALPLVQNIENFTDSEESSIHQSSIFNYLVQSESPPSLLSFLKAACRNKDKDLIKAKVAAIKFLNTFIKVKHIPELEGISTQIFESCLEIFRRDESNEVKAVSLLPLKILLRKKLIIVADEEGSNLIFLEHAYKLLIDEFMGKKPSRGAKCEILKVLGLLLYCFPKTKQTLQYSDKILDICSRTLKLNFTNNSGSKEPELPAIVGAFSCLDRFLQLYPDKYFDDKELWIYIVKALKKAAMEDLFRFAMVGKALRLLKNHANRLQTYIGANSMQAYDCGKYN